MFQPNIRARKQAHHNMVNMAYMEQSRKTCSPAKKYTLYMYRKNRIKTYDSNYPGIVLYIQTYTFQIGQMVFAVAQNSYLYVSMQTHTHTKCDGISVELSISVIHNKATNKRANEQADERNAEDETKAKQWKRSRTQKWQI